MGVPLDLAGLLDREAIRDCILRTALANDARDPVAWKSAYWPEAHEDHPPYFTGNAHAFVDMIIPMLNSTMAKTWHQLGSPVLKLDGDQAQAMSYATARVEILPQADQPAFEMLVGVRYFDRLEKRDGEWRIIHRVTRGDWSRQFLLGGDIVDPGGPQPTGIHEAADPWRALFGGEIPPAILCA